MASKGGKSGKGKGPGKIGVSGGKGVVGKRGLKDGMEEVWEIPGTVIGEGKVLVGSEEEGWEVLVGLTRVGNFWTNGKVKIRCGKKGLDESGWKVWEDKEVEDTVKGKEKRESEDIEMGEGAELKVEKEEVWVRKNVDKVIGNMREGVKGGEWEKGEKKGSSDKKVKEEIEVVDLCGSSEGGSGVGLLEEWKVEKETKEKREKRERRKREVEGMVNREKDRGMRREDVIEMKQAFGDYEEVVGDVGYIFL